ncbi:hypothetical protein BTA51_10790 [Hahella sp. CCB-MM4]|nr:hypothetical protein BTA51_10790 [Hahella sp. CCB-MM4]
MNSIGLSYRVLRIGLVEFLSSFKTLLALRRYNQFGIVYAVFFAFQKLIPTAERSGNRLI